MHPMFVELFITPDVESQLDEEQAIRRRGRQSRRTRSIAVKAVPRDQNRRPYRS